MENEFKTTKKLVSETYKGFGLKNFATCANKSYDLIELYNFLVSDRSMLEDLIDKLDDIVEKLETDHPDINFGSL